MNALGVALIGFGVLLLYWLYVEPHTAPATAPSGPPSAYGPVPGAPSPFGSVA
ncbi:MAG: hypothetical protein KGK07_16575 [Chloroflexota bacterium]|nr:hypothetical protein [Chloroflexota bacterium]